MDIVGVTVGVGILVFLGALAWVDYRFGRVDSVSVLVFLGMGAVVAIVQAAPQRSVLALFLAFCGVAQAFLWRPVWGVRPVGWADWLVLASLALYFPFRQFSFILFFASGVLFIGAASGYLFKMRPVSIRALPVMWAATVVSFVVV